MKFIDKLKKSKKRSIVSSLIALISIIYFIMMFIKGLYFVTEGSTFPLNHNINEGIKWLFTKTWVFPISTLWNVIPAIPFEGSDIFAFYKVIIPPFVVLGLCTLFITDYRVLKSKFHDLKAEIEKEIALREMREDAGLDTLKESAIIDIAINNATNNDPAWHNTWWGKVIIGVAITLVVTAIGLK